MKINPIIAALFAASALPSYGASNLVNLLNTYTGTSQDNGGTSQSTFLTDPATGLEVSSLAASVAAGTAAQTIYFYADGVSAPNFPGLKFGANNATNGGRNYLRTTEIDYNTKDFTAFVTVRRSALDANNRKSVFFGLGSAARVAQGKNPDEDTTNASAYFELQNGWPNVSRRAQSNTQANAEIGYHGMTTFSDNSIRMRIVYNSVATTLTLSLDYSYVPGEAFTADQTFPALTIPIQANEWAGGDRASIFFGGDRSVFFTDLNIAVTAPPRPPTPTALESTDSDGNFVTLEWKTPLAIPDTTYSVYRSTTAGVFTDPAIATGLPSTTYTDNTVVDGTTYFYRVTQSNLVAANPESLPGNELLVRAASDPVAPPGVIAVNAGKNALLVDWDDLKITSISYTVRRSTSPTGPFNTISGSEILYTSRFLDETVSDGTTYYYRVSSTKGVIESPVSAIVSATSKPLEVFVDFNNGATATQAGAGGLKTPPLGTTWGGRGLGTAGNLKDSSDSLSSVVFSVNSGKDFGGGTFSKANGVGVGGDNSTLGSQTLTVASGYNLMSDYVFQNAGGTTTTSSLTGLVPNRKYDLYLYGYGDQLGQNTLFGVSSILKQTNNPTSLTTLTEGRHFVTFTTVADDSGKVTFTWRNVPADIDTDANSGSALLAGFQLVENINGVLQPLSLSAIGARGANNLTWSGVQDATSYNVYRSLAPTSGFSLVSLPMPTTASFSDTTATAGVTYYYAVTALNGTTESFISAQTSSVSLPAVVDTDLDGLSDSDEALIGSNPNDINSFFTVVSSNVTENAGNYDVTIILKGAKGQYVIERSTTLESGSWTDANTPVTWTWTNGAQDQLTLSATGLTPATEGKEFFRAKAVVPTN